MSTVVLMKKELMLNGLTCAHCAQTIGEAVKNIEGVYKSYMNFVNKKLTLEIDSSYDEDEILNQAIELINSIEPGLDIQLVSKKIKSNNKKELFLNGLTCAHCASVIDEKVKNVVGVQNSNLNFTNKKLSVEIDSDNEENIMKNIINIINDTEPGLDIKMAGEKAHKEVLTKKNTIKDNEKLNLLKIIAGTIVFSFSFYQETVGIENKYSMIIFLIAYLLVGGDVLYKAFKNITKGRIFDENFLMSVATIGAIAIGEPSEAVGVMLFYKVGEYLQELAVGKSRKSISELMQLRPDVANLKVGNTVKTVNPEDVKIGDCIIVKPGEKVPLDGVVVEGSSMVDTSALTGESVLRTVKKGDDLLSGFINKNTLLTIEVTKDFSESTVSKILDMVENASSKK